jgi:hypothetical protein
MKCVLHFIPQFQHCPLLLIVTESDTNSAKQMTICLHFCNKRGIRFP